MALEHRLLLGEERQRRTDAEACAPAPAEGGGDEAYTNQ
jgi:hypothetical protein